MVIYGLEFMPAGMGLVFFCLFSLGRFQINTGLIERPVISGLVWGLITGDLALSLSVSLVFELLWLDLIPAGNYIPPNYSGANVLALAIMDIFSLSVPARAAVVIILVLPFAHLASKVDYWLRRQNDKDYDLLQQWSLSHDNTISGPGTILLQSLLRTVLAYAVFFMVALSVLCLFFYFSADYLKSMAHTAMPWNILWLGASVGGFLSVRSRTGYILMAVVFVCIAGSFLI